MAASGPILPVIDLKIDYEEERGKIADFLRFYKGDASRVEHSSLPVLDTDLDEEDDVDRVLSGGLNSMDVDPKAATSSRSSRHLPIYMLQLQRIANREQESLVIDLNDVAKVSNSGCRPLLLVH